MSAIEIVDRGTVYSPQAGSDSSSSAFGQICVLPSGRWVCSFRAAPTKQAVAGQKAAICWSDDQGKSWSEPIMPFDGVRVEGKSGVLRGAALTPLGADRLLAALMWVDNSDPSLPFFNEETEGLLNTLIFFSISEDQGAHWSLPQRMETPPFDIPVPVTGPVLVLGDGRLACQFELNKHYYDTSPWKHRSVLMFSEDGGKTWPEYVYTGKDPDNRIFYWDQRPSVLADGRILDLFWTYDTVAAVYLNIHACESTDHGRTWSAMWDTGVPGQPARPVSLPGGSTAMVYVDRTAAPAIKARTSGDYGRSWPDESELVIYDSGAQSQIIDKSSMDDAWAEMEAYSIGLPATTRLPDGDVLTVYYAGTHCDHTEIQWARLRQVSV